MSQSVQVTKTSSPGTSSAAEMGSTLQQTLKGDRCNQNLPKVKRPVERRATLGQLLADVAASGGECSSGGELCRRPLPPGVLREMGALHFVSSGGVTATRAARCPMICTPETDAEGSGGCWSHTLSCFSPTSTTAQHSRKRAGRRCGIQRFRALLKKEGPQIPISTVQVSLLCMRVLACVCVHALGGSSLFPILESWLLFTPGTMQHPQIFNSLLPLETASRPGNSLAPDSLVLGIIKSPLCKRESSYTVGGNAN